MKKIIIFDLDGTLADVTHRLHHIQGENKDWDSFHKACVDDKVIESTAQIYRNLCLASARNPVYILTGRSDIVREETVQWLKDNHLWTYEELLMRDSKNTGHDTKTKLKMLHSITNDLDNILCVFEDRDRMVNMWRSLGVTCYQVIAGDY